MSAETTLEQALEPLRRARGQSAVLLDVDGTLAPIVRHADDAHVPEPTRSVLIRVAHAYAVTACVSGRQAAIARRIVSIGSISYVGNHGGELLRAGRTEPELEPGFARGGERVRAFARTVWRADPQLQRLRMRSEDKGDIAAFHWRGAPDEAQAEAAAERIAQRAEAEGLAPHWGRKVLEVRPPVQVDKGAGIAWLLSGAPQVRAALYVGDDLTDLDAFRGLRALVESGGLQTAVCVGVRSDETPPELEREADLLVDGPSGVRHLLEALL